MNVPTPVRRLFGYALILMMLLSLAITPRSASAATTADGRGLSKHDHELLAEARAKNEATVTLLIAARPGANRTVATGIAKLGGTVAHRDDDISYIRANVPTGQAEAAARLEGVQAANLDEIIPLDDPKPDGAQAVTPQIPPSAGTPNNNAYMPTGDTGASQFVAANPTFDGRGTTVGIVDSGIDLDHPSLRTTTTGERKVVDWVTATHPTDDNDATWISMADQVSGAAFTYKNVAYTAPAAASYRIGLFNERDSRLGGEVGSDVNRDGNPKDSSGIFAVLWNTDTNNVYVDANQNNSFADESAMTDYRVRNDIGTFGTDKPNTAVREAMPFVVQTDGKNKVVNIGIVSGAHGSHVAGIVAANDMFGGEMTGAAPGAKLVSVRVCLFIAGCTAHALIEGMTWVAKQGNVDVINMSIGGLPSLNDGNNARAILYSRLIEQYNVQMFISAGNSGPGVNTIGDPSVATKVMSVGSYITNETWQKNYGSDSEFTDNLHPFSSRGPSEDGGFKPQIVAPGSAISTVPTWQPGGPVGGTYELPPGYAMFNGTSMASPQAAGAAALLVSAAKQHGVQSQPAQLRQAINSSARYLDRYEAFDQGNGLMDVAGAWKLLQTNTKPVEITSSVAVRTALSGFLSPAGVGKGIHDREGVKAGDSYKRTYTFTRTSGGSKAVTYNLSWVGNNGTFSSAGSVSLPLNRAVSLPVSINPTAPGSHAAILNLNDPNTAGVEYQTMNVVIAADQFNAANNYSVTKSGEIGRNQALHYFFNVPAGTPAFKVDLAGPSAAAGTGQVRFLRFHPYGVGFDSNSSLACYVPAVPGGPTCNGTTRTAQNPQAGVWEVTVEARRTSDVENSAFTLTASILGATVSPNPDVIESATANIGVNRTYEFKNLYGAFTGRATNSNLSSALVDRKSIGNLEQKPYEVVVDAGSTSLTARIGKPSDLAADLDLFIFKDGVLKGQSADGDSEEAVTIANPAAGTYTIRIDGYAVPAGTTTYDYLDVFANAKFGEVAVTDADALRPAGSTWTAPGVVTAKIAPATGRILLGNVFVRTDGNVTIGTGEVRVNEVK